MTETQLFEKCKRDMLLIDLENYFNTFPQGDHISHIKGWYRTKLIEHLTGGGSPLANYKESVRYKTILDMYRKNDVDGATWWSSLITEVMALSDQMRAKYVEYLAVSKGNLSAKEYSTLFDETVLREDDFESIGITQGQLEQLKNVSNPVKISISNLEEEDYKKGKYRIPSGCGEIYFWGMPASGKSCCLSAVLSTIETLGYGDGYEHVGSSNTYFEKLTNIMRRDGSLSTLMEGTNENSIACAPYVFNHPKLKKRQVCLIDLAGETFKSMHACNNDETLDDVRQLCLNVTTSYLNADNGNRKLHFFIIPYMEKERFYDGLSTSQFLQAGAHYLKRFKIIKELTDGIYIIVTKADLMHSNKGCYQADAEKYIKSRYLSFYNSMNEICKENGIGKGNERVKILPFSIGQMISKETCIFDQSGAEQLIDLICEKAPKVTGRLRSWINKVLGA